MDEETVSAYETDTEVQTSVHDKEAQIQSSFSEPEKGVTETSMADTIPPESSVTETDKELLGGPSELGEQTEASIQTSIVTENGKESQAMMEEAEEREQRVQDLEHVQSMDELVEKVLDLEKFDLTEEYLERLDNLDDTVSVEDKSAGRTPVEVQSAEILYSGDDTHSDILTQILSDPFALNELVLIAPPSTPIQEVDASEVDETDDSQISQEFIERLQEVVISGDSGKVKKINGNDGDKQRTSAESEGKKTVSTIRKAGFRTGSASDVSAKYLETEFDTGRERSTSDTKQEQARQQAECTCYAGVENFATGFVDNIIDTSINNIATNRKPCRGEFSPMDGSSSNPSSMHTYVEIFGTFTRWPRIQEFSRGMGEVTINEYMLTWDYEEEWLHCINFLLEQSDGCSDYYFYEAKWSIPSKPYPIPQATASIYFTIEVSRIKPPYCPVDVTYVFEGSRFIHAPGKIQFQEQWLFDIIDAKIKLFKRIRF